MKKSEIKKVLLTLVLPLALTIIGFIGTAAGAINKNKLFFGTGLIIMLAGIIVFFKNKKKLKINAWQVFAMSWLFVDGCFHAFAVADFIEGVAPDAVIARGLLELAGALPIYIHRIMGAFLLSTTVYALYLLTRKKKSNKFERIYLIIYTWVEAPITIAIIAIGIILNLLGIGI
jgi:hypothetical protein